MEIARALAAEPKFILLDEPFTGVDPKAIEDIEIIIYRLSKRDKIGILITRPQCRGDAAHYGARLHHRGRREAIRGAVRTSSWITRRLATAYFGEHYGQSRNFAREAAEAELRRMSHEWDEDSRTQRRDGWKKTQSLDRTANTARRDEEA